MFVNQACSQQFFSEETSVMYLHGELRNIIFDDSPLYRSSNTFKANRPWSSGKWENLPMMQLRDAFWVEE